MVVGAPFVLLFVLGVAWWTLLEYLLHRLVFHRFPEGRHMQHHAHLADRRLAVARLRTSVTGAAIHGVILIPLLGLAGVAVLAGVLAGYLAYEVVHYRAHYGRARTRLGKALRRHHMLHHFKQPDARFGVTTFFWDRVFGTLPVTAARSRAARPAGHRASARPAP